MPIYEFQCNGCGTDFEKLVRRISAVDEVSCPECESDNIHKKLSLFASKVSSTSQSSSSIGATCSPSGS